jgi:hypothetical protein
LPLQEFWPLQVLLAVLQVLCPLQELTPAQRIIVVVASEADAKAGVIENMAAAPIAIATPVAFTLFMKVPFMLSKIVVKLRVVLLIASYSLDTIN